MAFRNYPEAMDRRFWSKVRKSDGCWMWIGAKNHHGYGHLAREGRHWMAHRLAYALCVGPVPDDMDLCHHCDTPACVNPAHLFVGTRTDNMRDAKAKGRTARGERHGRSRLTATVIAAIRDMRQRTGASVRAIGEVFGVSPQHVHRIISGDRWGHLKTQEAA